MSQAQHQRATSHQTARRKGCVSTSRPFKLRAPSGGSSVGNWAAWLRSEAIAARNKSKKELPIISHRVHEVKVRVDHLAQLRVGRIQDGRPVRHTFCQSASCWLVQAIFHTRVFSNQNPADEAPRRLCRLAPKINNTAKCSRNFFAVEKWNKRQIQSRCTFVHFRVAGLPEVDVAKRTCTVKSQPNSALQKSAHASAHLHWCSIDPNLRADCSAELAAAATRRHVECGRTQRRDPRRQQRNQQQRRKMTGAQITCDKVHLFRIVASRRHET